MNQHETFFFFLSFWGIQSCKYRLLLANSNAWQKEKVVPVVSSRTCHAECVNADKTKLNNNTFKFSVVKAAKHYPTWTAT